MTTYLVTLNVLTAEISRLQNSLAHLRNTQEQLREAQEESPDPEFERAIQENEDVMYVLSVAYGSATTNVGLRRCFSGSQEERISILRIALAEKGASTSCYQEFRAGGPVEAAGIIQTTETDHHGHQDPSENSATDTHPPTLDSHDIVIDEDGGIDL